MSKNFNRAKASKCNSRKELKIKVVYYNDPYWEDHWSKHTKYNWGSKQPNKVLYQFQYRMYRSWKHNRKTQYK